MKLSYGKNKTPLRFFMRKGRKQTNDKLPPPSVTKRTPYAQQGLVDVPFMPAGGRQTTFSMGEGTGQEVEIDLQEVDVGSFVKEAQPYILKAIDDPSSLASHDLEEVASVLVSRAWEDPLYYSTAAKVCSYISELERQKELDIAIPKMSFRRSMLENISNLLKDWQDMRKVQVEYWMSFCRFLSLAYRRVRPGGSSMGSLCSGLYEALMHLVQPPCVHNFDEVELLSSIFHECGRDLQADDKHKMAQLMVRLRDLLLESRSSTEVRGMLLPLIELQASNWELSQNAQRFYFDM